jgi:hypothetical protein
MRNRIPIAICVLAAGGWLCAVPASGNGGPFVVQYPGGDPAAKGVMARFDLDLRPGREERLRVIKEDLNIIFDRPPFESENKPAVVPLASVSAEYTIENPTDQKIQVDFGFPILRGIYLHPFSMVASPDVQVKLNGDGHVSATVISNSMIYGIIRQLSRETIEKTVAGDARLAELVAAVRASGLVRQRARATIKTAYANDSALTNAVNADPLLGELVAPVGQEADHEAARAALGEYLRETLKWAEADAALMVEFAGNDLGDRMEPKGNQPPWWYMGHQFSQANLGPFRAIGEQKATQFLARLASCCEQGSTLTYEDVFAAWGGDVRERSVDLKTGRLRPREIEVGIEEPGGRQGEAYNPTVYARVDYLEPNTGITKAQRESCLTVLKNLQVVFAFSPMNLLRYQVTFPPNSTQTLTVKYRQYPYKDTREPVSYQLAYVLHPASLWKEFGPIHLEVAVPQGVPIRASVPCPVAGVEEIDMAEITPGVRRPNGSKVRCDVYRTTLTDKTGELFVGLDAAAWAKAVDEKKDQPNGKQISSR